MLLALALVATWPGGCRSGIRPSETTAIELANLTYAGVHDEPIELSDGQWTGEPSVPGGASRPNVELVADLRRDGDLDGDGVEEAVVVLLDSSGGTGVFSHVAVVGRVDGELANLGTALLGDRVQLRTLRVAQQQIAAEVVQSGPQDAMCCPTQLATHVFELRGDALQEIAAVDHGSLSLATLEASRWLLTHFDWDQKAPAKPVVTLNLSEGRASGSSGCNRYFASFEAGDAPGTLTVGGVGGTRMACPGPEMELERDYLRSLSAVTRYGFVNTKLSLGGKLDGRYFTLLFDPAPPAD
jgi:heat shock protein HslJ